MKKAMKSILVLCSLLSFSLTAQETMKLVYFHDFAPLSWDKDGKTRGVLIDIMNEALNKRMGINISHSGFPWARAQKMVKDNKADAFVTVPTAPRRKYTMVSRESVIVLSFKLYTQKDNSDIKKYKTFKCFSDLKGLILGDYFGNGWGREKLGGLNVHWVSSLQTALQMLAKKRFDAVIGPSIVTPYNIKQLGLKERLIKLPFSYDSPGFNLCIGKKSPFRKLLPQFDTTIRQMKKDGTIKKICEKYY